VSPTRPVLSLRGYGVAFGAQVVLAAIDLEVPARGMVVLAGEAGSGKSTLLRTLAGLNDAQPALRTWGEAVYEEAPLGHRRPALVQQNVRLLTATVRENLASALPDRGQTTRTEQLERIGSTLARLGVTELQALLELPVVGLSRVQQRLVAIVRGAVTGAPLLLVDEPTAGLDPVDATRVVDLVARLARDRAVVLVTHNQREVRALGGKLAFLAGGRIRALRRTESFLDTPKSPPAKSWVETGRSRVPSPMAKPEDLSDSAPPPPPLPPEATAPVSREVGPRGFYWLDPGRLGGLPRPGIVLSLDQDLDALKRLGVTLLVTLEEEFSLPTGPLIERGLRCRHFPIDDMRAPTVEAARALCEEIEALLGAGEVVAVHCRAGMGRTGTMLACQLIHRGDSALDALERARGINPRWVQSEAQVDFLALFERKLRAVPGVSEEAAP
jgi:atypical dual specificity phosphatase